MCHDKKVQKKERKKNIQRKEIIRIEEKITEPINIRHFRNGSV